MKAMKTIIVHSAPRVLVKDRTKREIEKRGIIKSQNFEQSPFRPRKSN